MAPDLESLHERAESTLTIKWGVIIVFVLGGILGFFGWLGVNAMSHESRITKVETKLEIHIPQINATLTDMKDVIKEIRADQVRRQEKEQ